MTLFMDCPPGEADEDGNARFWFFLFHHGLLKEEFSLDLSMDDGVNLTDGLVLHYDGTVVDGRLRDRVDPSGVADLDLYDVEVVPGRMEGKTALRFNGRSSYGVSRTHVDAVELEKFTLSLWFRTDNFYADPVISYGWFGKFFAYWPKGEPRSFNGDGNNYGWMLEYLAGTQGDVQFSPSGVGSSGIKQRQDGNWHHIVVIFNPMSPYQLYTDATLECEVDYTQKEWTPKYIYNNRIYLGSLGDFYNFGFLNADLGDIRIYDRILNGDEIQALFQIT